MRKDSVDCAEVRRLMPHRYPFLLVDRVSRIEVGRSCVGEKNVTLNEPCYDNVINDARTSDLRYPVPLQLESFAQVGALLILAGRERIDVDVAHVMIVGAVRGMKIYGDVLPGDTMLHHVRIDKELSDTVVISGEIHTVRPGQAASVRVVQVESFLIGVRPREALFSSTEAV